MVAKSSTFPGFTPISDRIFLRNEDSNPDSDPLETTQQNQPTTIVVYGWGDGLPKHVAKYVDGYHKLFPAARILMVISSTFAASYESLEKRTKVMLPIIDAVFSDPDDESQRVILHAMSNTGGIYMAATLNAFQYRHGKDKTLPHHLCVVDSTPGSTVFSTEVSKWAKAMALGSAKWFPWPFAVTHGLWWAFLYAMFLVEKAFGRVPSGVYSCRVFLDHTIATTKAPRLFLYSKTDDIIGWEDIEANAAQAQSSGYKIDLEMFEDSPHVGHMRMHPVQYWSAIERCWNTSMELEYGGKS
ncbi:DUF829-domain-containing protein [Hypoxylon trugodes]|uniref:DUF829-domain-containing protein n=1 Tax=Hypoxylon trugodes TaxID=326681 RepID=UPI00219DDFE3|nr:DUF829-domain-containing protein [Hypoxylon trugodes]KAI1385498.1 DUF829-domain-containing protein [Hypoxylon trugodes]